MKVKRTETSIQSEIINFLKFRKICVFRINTKGEVRKDKKGELFLTKNENKGFSDLLVLHNGMPIFLEVKTDVGKLSKEQSAFANKVVTNGAHYFVVRSKQDVKICLEGIGVNL